MPRNQKPTFEQKVVIGFFKAIAFLIMGLFRLIARVPRQRVIKSVSNHRVIKPQDKITVNNRWREIQDLLLLGGISQLRQALLEADKLLDFSLRLYGSAGKDLGERLKASQQLFSASTYNGIWEAHKLRNILAHEIHNEVYASDIRQALEQFKRGLEELRML